MESMSHTPSILVFHGDEPLQIEESLKKTISDYSQYTVEIILDHTSLDDLLLKVSMTGLFSSQLLIIANDAWFLHKSLDDSQLKLLSRCCECIQQNGHIMAIAMVHKSLDQRIKSVKLLKKFATFKQFKAFQDWELNQVYQWVQQRLQDGDKTISASTIELLVMMTGTHLPILAQYIDLLITYIGDRSNIVDSDIHALSAETSQRIFDFSEAIKERHLNRAIVCLKSLLRHGEEPVQLLGLITANIRLYFMIHTLTQQGYTYKDIGKQLGKHPFFIQKLAPIVCKRYSLQDLRLRICLLSQSDIAIKSGALVPKKALELAVIKVCS